MDPKDRLIVALDVDSKERALKLIDELATVALANYDARVRFETRAKRGNPGRALKLLDKLDRALGDTGAYVIGGMALNRGKLDQHSEEFAARLLDATVDA